MIDLLGKAVIVILMSCIVCTVLDWMRSIGGALQVDDRSRVRRTVTRRAA